MKKAGTLLHITSLPSKYKIGSMGDEAYQFIRFLKKSHQSIWQVLPINPTSYGNSPYQSPSAFAGNPYLIDFDFLVKDGLLKKDDFKSMFDPLSTKVDYKAVFENKKAILRLCYANYHLFENEFNEFKEKESFWLNDYSCYEVIKKSHNYAPWYEWPQELKMRDSKAISDFISLNKEEIDSVKFIQFLFQKQWLQMKSYANRKGIEIMGDMPIYVAYDSADVWANPNYYELNDKLEPKRVAGCPPDDFCEDGQLWGNPLYDWQKMKNDGFSFWLKRIARAAVFFDLVRIDHFRGFAGYYAIEYGSKDAKSGVWVEGVGYSLFEIIKDKYPNLKIVAENLGFLDDKVHELLDKCGYPGMHIIQFELGDGKKYIPLEEGFDNNNFFYSGTHDNQTLYSWYSELNSKFKNLLNEICEIKDDPNWDIISYIYKSNLNTAIFPFQDYLKLDDSKGRMNIPSKPDGNWEYMTSKKDFKRSIFMKLKRFGKAYQRF